MIVAATFSTNQKLNDQEIPEQHLISLDLCIQPDSISCGPTCVCMVLSTYNRAVTVEEIKLKTKTVWLQFSQYNIGMTSPDYILVAFHYYRVPVRLQQGNISALKFQIYQNRPCIVLVRSGEFSWHYLVVIGYDLEHIIVANPSDGEIHYFSNEIFLNCWNWTGTTRGNKAMSGYPVTLLNMLEIYPNTMIFPEKGAK